VLIHFYQPRGTFNRGKLTRLSQPNGVREKLACQPATDGSIIIALRETFFEGKVTGTLSLNSGPRFGTVLFGTAPAGACCYANFSGVYSPKPFIGYKNLDLRVAKTFKMPFAHGHELTLDFQVYNVFNWLNRTYSAWGAGSASPPALPTLIENGQAGTSRQFQAGIKYKF
jgi:outer membrane receptor protein involved in Fe transport